jgi:hypothetical protein
MPDLGELVQPLVVFVTHNPARFDFLQLALRRPRRKLRCLRATINFPRRGFWVPQHGRPRPIRSRTRGWRSSRVVALRPRVFLGEIRSARSHLEKAFLRWADRRCVPRRRCPRSMGRRSARDRALWRFPATRVADRRIHPSNGEHGLRRQRHPGPGLLDLDLDLDVDRVELAVHRFHGDYLAPAGPAAFERHEQSDLFRPGRRRRFESGRRRQRLRTCPGQIPAARRNPGRRGVGALAGPRDLDRP